MRLAALLAFIYPASVTASFAFQKRRLAAPDDLQNVLANSELSRQGQPQLPVSSNQLTGSSSLLAGFVAFGDSYSTGIGTGFDGKEDDCRHGRHAHTRLIADDLSAIVGGRNRTAFQLLSCTGATTQEILSGDESQIDAFNVSLPADFAFLSVGGNDLGFFDVINACVFRFYHFYSGTCEEALKRARAHIESDEFDIRLQIIIMEILDKVRWEKKPWFVITVTGYARFFNEVTDECDDMSFGIWWNGPKLKKELRLKMNAMVLVANAKIRKTIDIVNSRFAEDKVLFVDYDKEFEGHRFCEQNVMEPDYGRNDTWFFLVGGPDNARNDTLSKQASGPKTLSPSSPLTNTSSCLQTAQRSGDWGELALCYMAMSRQMDPGLRFARGDLVAENSMWYVPTYYGKTFHPRSLGHEVMKNKIYQVWNSID
ncbi:SGNH hydrolase [Xylariaceae sp. FL0662B]|nr:SGNH hydrolase [Xylariaceae sp. FL0662B]